MYIQGAFCPVKNKNVLLSKENMGGKSAKCLKILTSCVLGAAGTGEVMNASESESRASPVLIGF